MKMKNVTKYSLVFVAFLFVAANNVHASDSKSVVLTKSELIDKLTPKKSSKIKMRGIQMGEPEPAQAPSVNLSVNFAYNSYEINEIALTQLQPLGEALKSGALENFSFAIEGHTDAVGSDSYNMSLSEQRALAIGNFLYNNYSIDPSRLNLAGKGETELFDASNPDSESNRRVQITTLVQ